jgi:nicotinamidase-related amidase
MPSNRALIVIDVLVGVFELGEPVAGPEAFLSTLETLLGAARERKWLVVHLHHQGPAGSPFEPGKPGAAIHPRVAPLGSEIVVFKRHPDGFHDTELEQVLRSHDVAELAICGFATEGCVDGTVRSAYRLGFRTRLVADGHTTTDNGVLAAEQIIAHHNLILGRFSQVCPAAELLDDWLPASPHAPT